MSASLLSTCRPPKPTAGWASIAVAVVLVAAGVTVWQLLPFGRSPAGAPTPWPCLQPRAAASSSAGAAPGGVGCGCGDRLHPVDGRHRQTVSIWHDSRNTSSMIAYEPASGPRLRRRTRLGRTHGSGELLYQVIPVIMPKARIGPVRGHLQSAVTGRRRIVPRSTSRSKTTNGGRPTTPRCICRCHGQTCQYQCGHSGQRRRVHAVHG